ncbi:unnamed protein product [Diamesa hyperborea]
MDDEVTKIFKKWKLSNTSSATKAGQIQLNNSDKFDSSTYTRPKKKICQKQENYHFMPYLTTELESQNLKVGVMPINLQIGGPISLTPLSMQKNWLRDISPPGTMGLKTQDISNSLITSSDFTNITNLLNNNETECQHYLDMDLNLDVISPNNNPTRDLVNCIFNKNPVPESTDDSILDINDKKDIESFDFEIKDDINITPKNLTFNTYNKNSGNITWEKIKNHHLSNVNETNSIQKFQSTPYQSNDKVVSKINFGNFLSPICTENSENTSSDNDKEEEEIVIRKPHNLMKIMTMEDYRQSIEDHSEFILNEETIKLCKTVKGETFECMDDLKTALMNSAESNEKDFDEILDIFNVKKSLEGDRLLQSVDNIKQRHSLINLEKQRVEKQRKEYETDNRTQYSNETMSKSSESVRLLNRRSRLYDDVNLQICNLQKQRNELIEKKTIMNENFTTEEDQNENFPDLFYDKSNRDRFKTIKINKKLESGMVVIVNPDEQMITPEENKDQRNQSNIQKQDQPLENKIGTKKQAVPSKLSHFGFSRPTYRSQLAHKDLKLTLRANSTDSLGDGQKALHLNQRTSNLKSPMGIKAKSIHNLVFNNNPGINRDEYSILGSLTKPVVSSAHLRSTRASSLARPLPSSDSGFKGPSIPNNYYENSNGRKITSIRPSSGYFGNKYNSKRNDSDTESGRFSPISQSSSSASSRSSVHNSAPSNGQQLSKKSALTGTIPKSGLKQPSNLRAPIARSGLRKNNDFQI